MARRRFGRLPEVRLHKRSGNGRVFINGREYWVGPFGSPEAKARYEEPIVEHGHLAASAPATQVAAEPVVSEPVAVAPISLQECGERLQNSSHRQTSSEGSWSWGIGLHGRFVGGMHVGR